MDLLSCRDLRYSGFWLAAGMGNAWCEESGHERRSKAGPMRATIAAVVALSLVAAAPNLASAGGEPSVAALQVALRTKAVYAGAIDGVAGPQTKAAVIRFQRRARLVVDGIPGPRTRRALGRLGRPRLGARVLRHGSRGWDVAALQFLLGWHGFAPGNFDGVAGSHTMRALRGFQAFAGLRVDGVFGPATLAALRRPAARSPLTVAWPLRGRVGSRYGPRGDRFHQGIDISAPTGVPIRAAAAGVVEFAGWNDGFGNLLVLGHSVGVQTYYAHLSRIDVRPGSRVAAGRVVGLVGATGHANGPHLHFEVHVRGAAVDPLSALP
jgi:peptidoglycan hydrolase-like protein with peptidoglycan-binding domain